MVGTKLIIVLAIIIIATAALLTYQQPQTSAQCSMPTAPLPVQPIVNVVIAIGAVVAAILLSVTRM